MATPTVSNWPWLYPSVPLAHICTVITIMVAACFQCVASTTFRLADAHPFVSVATAKLNGLKIDALIDSGANMTVADEQLASRFPDLEKLPPRRAGESMTRHPLPILYAA